jgi:hypothetical protein
MTAGDGVSVTPAELRSHATHVVLLADEDALARLAGGVVRLDAGAYGQLCGFVPTLLGGLQDDVLAALDSGTASLRDTADRLRTAAGSYDGSDDRAAAALR